MKNQVQIDREYVNLEYLCEITYTFIPFINYRLKSPFALVPIHIFSSFSYLMDIVKDLGQLAILIYALGGVVYIVKNWTSFTSVVSMYVFKD